VVPELASRAHLEKLQEITNKIFKKPNIDPKKIDVFTSTCGPGLIGSLLVGSTFTKSLSIGFNKPFFPVNHLEGHLLSTSFNNPIVYPHLVLLLTGGHTQMYLMHDEIKIELLGESVDDAIGEAFDKTAKLIGLGYPGGAQIEELAKYGDENYFKLPKPLLNDPTFNFSFSGIKTHINLLTKKNKIDDNFRKNISSSFQKTITEIIISKIEKVLEFLNTKNIFLMNRTKEKAQKIKEKLEYIEVIDWGDIRDFEMIINATSLGLNKEDDLGLNFESIKKKILFYDLIYNPEETKFLKSARQMMHIVENGKMMFIYQAHQSFTLWHKVMPNIDKETITILSE